MPGEVEHRFRTSPDHDVDTQKLRRFALAIALVLTTYSLAGVEFGTETVHLLGVPFNISRPEWLPIGLMIASALSAVRFWFYGMMLDESPARVRRIELGDDRSGQAHMFSPFHPINQDEAIRPPEYIPSFLRRLNAAFPRVPGVEMTEEMLKRGTLEVGGVQRKNAYLGIRIPFTLRAAARFQDLDYAAHIWLNVVALAIAVWRLASD